MTKREYLDLVGGPLLALYKPNTIDASNPAAVNELHGLYYRALQDYPASTVARGMALALAEHKNAWWPTIAELREFFGRAFAELRREGEQAKALSGPRTDWAAVPGIRRRLFRGWLGRHPEYFGWCAEFQHHVELFVRQHGELYAQRIATEGGADPFIELTAAEMRDATERYESQKYLRSKRGPVEEPPPANLLAMLAKDEPSRRDDDPPPTIEEIAKVDQIMAHWRGVVAALVAMLFLAGCASGCPQDNPRCVPAPSPASIGGFMW